MLRDAAPAPGYTELHRSLLMLRRYPSSVWRHNNLLILARVALRDGFPLAARLIEDEDLLTAAQGMTAVSLVEARLQRSRSSAAIGALPFDSAMAEGRRTVGSIADSSARQELTHEMMVSEATHLAPSHPDSAARLADSAIAFFAPRRRPGNLIPAFVARATSAIAKGDLAAGRTFFARATASYDQIASSSARPDRASAAISDARDAFDALTLLAVKQGATEDALSIVEQGRRSFRPWTARGTGAATPTRGAVISYTLIGDTLLTWVLHRADTAFFRQVAAGGALRASIREARAALELHAPRGGASPASWPPLRPVDTPDPVADRWRPRAHHRCGWRDRRCAFRCAVGCAPASISRGTTHGRTRAVDSSDERASHQQG